MNNIPQEIFTRIYHIVASPLFKLGDTPVSIGSIFQLILSLLFVFFITRACKNFLKHRLLIRLNIDEGNREAIATIISYSFGTLGLIVVLQTTGFNLASLAVLVGGLGVGIGLGLQDATKNFVSGLTLLLERKLKVGDFVELNSLSGFIREISIRSTLIRTRDGAYVVVPNSKLAEDRIVNWSYDGFKSRIKVPVGVSYNSDPVVVTEILLKSAYMEKAVFHEPTPEVIFKGFMDSCLGFELWVWVNRIDREPQIKSSLNFIIEYNLRQQGITIPFPQMDLWFRNAEVFSPSPISRSNGHDTPQMVQQELPKQLSKPLAIRDLLRQVTYFHNFTDLELRQLIEIGYRKRLGESRILFREGDPGDAFYIILSGSIEVFVEKLDKRLTTLETGNFFGELSLMLGIPRTASVRALEDTILFVINNKGFEKLLHEQPELAEIIIEELGKHQEELAERQQQLRAMGLVDAAEDDKNPVAWVRKRLNNLFSL
ncbi:mechanosensitive ion channel domain-containing protein [Allocoleopsis franciscana]|uniref:Small-conductance mechanosensitive channel n=1 Tax=Allocoleopsis franciscana PCC 7113 TaxID=1173027 RepID=K9W6X6_9CYAN|nr:small-conductance mechanosensitive channel [Allocoleopsis franciscana PCC 7113]